MKISQNGINLIKEFEGLRLACYHLGDGVCTIGYGFTRPLSQCRGVGSWTITREEAERKLIVDIVKYENGVNHFFTRNFNQNQFDALVSFAWNLGAGIFAKDNWSKTATNEQITNLMIKYVNPPQFREGLTRRRKAEIALFNTPVSSILQQPTIIQEEEEMEFLVKSQTGHTPQGHKSPMSAGAVFYVNTGQGIYRHVRNPTQLGDLQWTARQVLGRELKLITHSERGLREFIASVNLRYV